MANNEETGEIEAPITINIGNICKGAIIDAFNKELQKCLNNIYDLDTPATATRGITLKEAETGRRASKDRGAFRLRFDLGAAAPGR